MSLIEYIENLQRKPRHVRLQIMWVGSILGAAVIFVFWLWSLSFSLAQAPVNDKGGDQALQSLKEIKEEMPGLWQSLSAGISEVISAAKGGLNSSPSVTPSSSPSINYQTERLPIE